MLCEYCDKSLIYRFVTNSYEHRKGKCDSMLGSQSYKKKIPMRYYCSLSNGKTCWFSIDEFDILLKERMKQHYRWHKHCMKEKRNNTEGNVVWLLKK